ncbi:MAG: hypothetical protein NTNFB01_08130 [Nitrospira sp.]|jgi:hypothetical protein
MPAAEIMPCRANFTATCPVRFFKNRSKVRMHGHSAIAVGHFDDRLLSFQAYTRSGIRIRQGRPRGIGFLDQEIDELIMHAP